MAPPLAHHWCVTARLSIHNPPRTPPSLPSNLVSSVFTAGQTTLLAGSVGTDVESEEAIFNSDPIHGRADLIWDGLKATMETSALQLESVSRAMYVTSKLQHIKSAVRDMLYETPNIQVQR